MKIMWIAAAVLLLASAALPAGAIIICSCDDCRNASAASRCIDESGTVVYCSQYMERSCASFAPAAAPQEQSLDDFLDHLASHPVEAPAPPAVPVTAR